MNTYYSTFITGFSEVISGIIRKHAKSCKIKLLLDGLIVYETVAKVRKIQSFPFFNNSFFLVQQVWQKENTLQKLIGDTNNFIYKKRTPPDILVGKRTFRIIISSENQLISIPKNDLENIEQLYERKLGLSIDRANPDVEVWFLERSEGYAFCGIRLTKKPSTDKYLQKGELRPELSYLLCFLSEPTHNDIFLDPFAGYGSIPNARTLFPYKQIIAVDHDTEKVENLRRKVQSEKKNVDVYRDDATHLSQIKDSSVDKIVTDPPWGLFTGESQTVDALYARVFIEFERVLKVSGLLVLLSSQKELVENLLDQKKTSFQLLAKYDILVSGKKAGVYKIIKK